MTEKSKLFLRRILPAAIAAGIFAATALWGAARSAEAKNYRAVMENGYRRTAYELCESVRSMETALAKLMVAGTPARHILLFSDLSRECSAAQSLLSELPAAHGEVVELNRFLVRMGDYSRSLAEQVLEGAAVSAADKRQLHALHETCAELSLSLAERMADGDIPLSAISGGEYYAAGSDSGGEYQQAGLEEFPTLIYDGPFSESSEKREPLGLYGNEIGEAEAVAAAEEAAGPGANFTSCSFMEGEIPCWDISGALADGRDISVSVTQQGGKLLSMMTAATGAAEGVPEAAEAETYRDAAADFLQRMGFSAMQATYAQYYAGMAVINFAAEQEGIILYSDLVKVWVDRQSGGVIGMDARGYWYSHRQRTLPEPVYTRDEAREMISDDLDVRSIRLALIPATPVNERLCYEFKGEYEGTSYIVYINALTLYEEQIFKILDSERGQLVI